MSANIGFQFDRETAVSGAASPHEWSALIAGAYNIGDKPNGGYLASVAVSAMLETSPHPDPISVNTHFLRPAIPESPATIQTEVVRQGRTVTTMTATLSQAGKPRLQVLATFGDLTNAGSSEEVIWSPPAPNFDPPDVCRPRTAADQTVGFTILSRVDYRVPESLNNPDHPTGALFGAWVRFVDNREPDAQSLLLYADAFPPPLFAALGQVGWVPTIELTVHVRKRPAPGWLRGVFSCTDMFDNRFIEDGQLWDSEGDLVAQSRQLGLLLKPPS